MALTLVTIDSEALYNNIIQSMEIACGEPLYPGDERRIYAEAVVQVMVSMANACNRACNNVMLKYASGEVLDAIGYRTGVERIGASCSSAPFLFTLTDILAYDLTIPADTLITADGTYNFATDEDLVITAGANSGSVTATCTEAGTGANGYFAGAVSQLVSAVPGISSAVNTVPTAGGTEAETDDSLRERIRLSYSAFSTAGSRNAYIYWAKTADASIIDVAVVTPSASAVAIYPLCAGGTLPSAAVKAAVLETCSADDVRPITDHVTVEDPEPAIYNIEIKYYTTAEDEEACVEAIEGTGGAVEQYIAWQCGALGRDINPDKLRALCLVPDSGTGCISLDVEYPAKTALSAIEVAQVGTVTISHEVVTPDGGVLTP